MGFSFLIMLLGCQLAAASSTVSSSPVLEARREKAGHECEARPAIPNRGGATGDEAELAGQANSDGQ